MSSELINLPCDHLVTGAAGFVAGNLLPELLRGSGTGRVHALARSSAAESARARVVGALRDRSFDDIECLNVLDGDVTKPQCGLSDFDIEQVTRRNVPLVFWHLAASLRWESGRRQDIFKANVDGTKNAVALARRLGADLYVHMSTAYTCGSLEGHVPEEIHEPASFNNVYEESKNAAERYVISQVGDTPRVLILRPSIIVGSSTTYEASGSYTGLYGFLSELRRYKKMLGDSRDVVRLAAKPDAVLSMIPVDYVVNDSIAIVSSELRSPKQNIYHLTADSGPTVAEQADYILNKLGLEQHIELVDGAVEGSTALELFFDRRMDFFSGYLRSTKHFARSIDTPRGVTLTEVKHLIDNELEKHIHDHE